MTRDVIALVCVILGVAGVAAGAAMFSPAAGVVAAGVGLLGLGLLLGLSS